MPAPLAFVLLSLCLFAISCTCPPPARVASPAPPSEVQSAPQDPPKTRTPPAPDPAPEGPLPGRGEKCNAEDKCQEGTSCIEYYGIAGTRGPVFKTCETQCKGDAECGEGGRCVTISDGPGQVCR